MHSVAWPYVLQYIWEQTRSLQPSREHDDDELQVGLGFRSLQCDIAAVEPRGSGMAARGILAAQ